MSKEELMRRALALARDHHPAPNPRVGAVVVKNGIVIGEGAHARPGEPHAEAAALNAAGADADGAELYVTLEPCCHSGKGKRTPPCTGHIIKSGIKKVIISGLDPNPAVNGRGAEILKSAGIQVEAGLLEQEEAFLNREYRHHRKTGRPWVCLKQAVSLDGFISEGRGIRTRLSGDEAIERVHRMRASVQAVIAGGSTVITDDPELTVRFAEGRSPVRIIIEGRKALSINQRVFDTSSSEVFLYSAADDSHRLSELQSMGVEVISSEGFAIGDILDDIGSRGIISAMVEGGSKLSHSLLSGGYIDEVSLLYSPVYLGKGTPMAENFKAEFAADKWEFLKPELIGRDYNLSWRRKAGVA